MQMHIKTTWKQIDMNMAKQQQQQQQQSSPHILNGPVILSLLKSATILN